MVRLETPRLVLRELRDDDWQALHRMESLPDVVRYLTKAEQSEQDAREYVQLVRLAAETRPRMVIDLAVTLRDGDDTMIGRCGLRRSDTEPREAMLWYVFAPAHHGHGYATEGARALITYAFEEFGLHRVFADADPRNPASLRVMEKLGMRREAHHVENVWIKGEWCDSVIAAVLRREWRG